MNIKTTIGIGILSILSVACLFGADQPVIPAEPPLPVLEQSIQLSLMAAKIRADAADLLLKNAHEALIKAAGVDLVNTVEKLAAADQQAHQLLTPKLDAATALCKGGSPEIDFEKGVAVCTPAPAKPTPAPSKPAPAVKPIQK